MDTLPALFLWRTMTKLAVVLVLAMLGTAGAYCECEPVEMDEVFPWGVERVMKPGIWSDGCCPGGMDGEPGTADDNEVGPPCLYPCGAPVSAGPALE